MNTLKKILFICAFGILSNNMLKAEKSGAFIGGGMSMNYIKYNNWMCSNNVCAERIRKEKGKGFSFVIGGKTFEPYASSGARYYIDIHYGFFDFHKQNGKVVDSSLMTININADYLYNFYDDDNRIFGIFLGIGGGLAAWDPLYYNLNPDIADTTFKPYMALNSGVRYQFGKQLGIELYSKLPLLKATLPVIDSDSKSTGLRARLQHRYNIGTQLILSF